MLISQFQANDLVDTFGQAVTITGLIPNKSYAVLEANLSNATIPATAPVSLGSIVADSTGTLLVNLPVQPVETLTLDGGGSYMDSGAVITLSDGL